MPYSRLTRNSEPTVSSALFSEELHHVLAIPCAWLLLLSGSCALAGYAWGGQADSAVGLPRDFSRPPAAARPWVYWFWLNSNITRQGITADLEAMKSAGIGGVLIMEVDQGAPLGRVPFMGEKWCDLFHFMLAEAHRLGLEVNMNDDAGWDGSGGPWIKPAEAMQKVVSSETTLSGPASFKASLPHPETNHGYYRDVRVLAFPARGKFRIANLSDKALYSRGGIGPAAEAKLPAEMVIDPSQLVDLTARLQADGRLTWSVPAGQWTVLRIGHTCTGALNAPAPASGMGLECDKLSKDGIEAQFRGMMAKLVADSPSLAGNTLVATHIDSWENGMQNWTAAMPAEFQRRRGYDLLPYLPVFTGRVVQSLEVSERFLWDLRQTISELLVENYAGRMEQLAQQHGLRLSIEAYDGPCDDTPYAGRADEPMCEFWLGGSRFETCKEMASAADTYGHRVVGGGILHRRGLRALARASRHDQIAGRPGHVRGRQPFRFPPLRHAALGDLQAGHGDGPLGPALRTHANLVGDGPAVARIPGPLPSHAPPRPLRGRHLLSATGSRPARICGTRSARLRFRHWHGGSRAHADERGKRSPRAPRRHAIPSPRRCRRSPP